MGYESNLKNVQLSVLDRLHKNMRLVAKHVKGEVIDIISRTQPIKHRKSGVTVGLAPSKPGEPPKVVTGFLRNSIAFRVVRNQRGVRGFVGVRKGLADEYGLYLELGTSKMAPRSFLRRVIVGDRTRIFKIIQTGRK